MKKHPHAARRLSRLARTSLMALLVAPAFAQWVPPPPPVNIKQQPLPARVAVGHGTEFSIVAIPEKNVVITRYDWMLNGRIVKTDSKPVWAVPAAQYSQAGQVSVNVVTSAGTVTSQAARLEVVGSGWVQVGGRAVSTQVAAQAPAVEVCGEHQPWPGCSPAAGPGQVKVQRFDGTGWRSMGATSVHARVGSDGAEPWLQCSDMPGHLGPLLAFSESAAAGRTIELRRFDGRNWLTLTSPPVIAGAEARKPTLRVVSALGAWPPMTQMATNTAVAWIEAGRPKVYQWLGQTWGGAFATGQDQDHVALAVDTFLRTASSAPYPALLAGTRRGSFGALNRWRPEVESKVFGMWSPIGHSLAVPTPAGVTVRMLGLAASEEASAPRVTVVWAELNGAAYTLKSATLGGTDYESSMLNSNAQAAWQGFASERNGTDLAATAFDAQAQEGPCYPIMGTVKSFTLALTDSRGTDVWRTDCSSGCARVANRGQSAARALGRTGAAHAGLAHATRGQH
jgi:hypothetical protein